MSSRIILAALSLTLPLSESSRLYGQLVADGTTATLNGVSTNLIGNLVIGTNGAFTTLIISNAANVSNTGDAIIGEAFTAVTNEVIVTDPNSMWSIGGNLNFSSAGSYSKLTILNGGRVENGGGNIAFNGGVGNVGLVSGANSVWTNRTGVNIGNAGSFNQLIVTNGGSVQSGSILRVGNYGLSNVFLLASGGTAQSVSAALGSISLGGGNLAVISDTGSLWTVASELQVGENSSFNTLLLTNRGNIISGGAHVGGNSAQSGSGSSNSVVITGAGSAWTNTSTASVGNFGSGNSLTIANGGVMRNTAIFAYLVLGWQPASSNNTLRVTGMNSLFSNSDLPGRLAIGQNGSFNSIEVSDGATAETDIGALGENASSSNNLAIITDPGSRWLNTSDLSVGNAGSGNQLTIGNGALVLAKNFYLGAQATSSDNKTIVNGGSLIATNPALSGLTDVRRGTLTLSAGLLRTDGLSLTNAAQGQLSFNGGNMQVGNLIHSNGNLFVVGNGTSQATLELLRNGTHLFAGGLLITNNARYSGSGTVIGNITNSSGGTLSPGSPLGQLAINGRLTLAAQSTNLFELDKSTATNDSIAGLTSVTFGGTLHVTNVSGTLAGSDAFKLFTAGSYNGSFAEIQPPTPGTDMEWDTNGLAVDGILRVASAPYIDAQPASQTVLIGQDATFTVMASGSVNMTYQWRFAGTNLTGANSNSYTRTNAQTSYAGDYTVVVANHLGSVTSSIATLTVELAPVLTHIVISQIYGGGGGAGATYRNDFVELFNPTSATIDLGSWSLQYANAAGGTWQVAQLRGLIAPYGYYLVQMGTSGATGATIPAAEATNTINVPNTSGKLALVTGPAPLIGGNPSGNAAVVDFVGYGAANAFEGTGPAPSLASDNSLAILRKNGGYSDVDDNLNDFLTVSPPIPRNSASATNPPSVPAIAAVLGSPTFNNDQFQFEVTGTAGSNYIVQATTSLTAANWVPLLTNTSPFTYTETNVSSAPSKLFRVRSAP